MLYQNTCLFFVIFLIKLAISKTKSLCEIGKTYWNMNEMQCQMCHTCSQEEIVLRPCQMFQDTICKSINEFSKFNQSYFPHKQVQDNHKWQLISENIEVIIFLVFVLASLIAFLVIAINYININRKFAKIEQKILMNY